MTQEQQTIISQAMQYHYAIKDCIDQLESIDDADICIYHDCIDKIKDILASALTKQGEVPQAEVANG